MYYSKRGEKKAISLKERIGAEKKYIKTQPAHLNITAFVDVFVPNA